MRGRVSLYVTLNAYRGPERSEVVTLPVISRRGTGRTSEGVDRWMEDEGGLCGPLICFGERMPTYVPVPAPRKSGQTAWGADQYRSKVLRHNRIRLTRQSSSRSMSSVLFGSPCTSSKRCTTRLDKSKSQLHTRKEKWGTRRAHRVHGHGSRRRLYSIINPALFDRPACKLAGPSLLSCTCYPTRHIAIDSCNADTDGIATNPKSCVCEKNSNPSDRALRSLSVRQSVLDREQVREQEREGRTEQVQVDNKVEGRQNCRELRIRDLVLV